MEGGKAILKMKTYKRLAESSGPFQSTLKSYDKWWVRQ